jgi:hypothetical protein
VSEDFRMALMQERHDDERDERNTRWLSVPCGETSHDTCLGPAWDEDDDVLTVCACDCHEED